MKEKTINKVYCKNCKFKEAVFNYLPYPADDVSFSHYECWHPKFKKYIKQHK